MDTTLDFGDFDSVELYKVTIDNIPIGINIIELKNPEDLGSFTFVAVNKAADEETGANMQEMVGKTYREALPRILDTDLPEKYRQVLISKKTTNVGIFEYGDDKIMKRWFQLKAFPIGERHVGIVFYNVDKQVHAEQKLNLKMKELKKKNKEIEQISYIASHDLQEPLHTISSMSEWLHKSYNEKLDEKGKKGFTFIIDAAARMKLLIKDIMGYSKIGHGNPRIKGVNLSETLENVKSDMSTSLEEHSVLLNIGEMPVLLGMETELRLLFQNLISNAIKFQKKENQPIISIKAEDKPEFWLFSVSDNGIGITKEGMAKVFQIFQRLNAKEEYNGTGIGLAHCKKVVEMHGGTLWVESTFGEGSAFYFTISKT